MIVNGNSTRAVNNFANVPMIPNQIIEVLINDKSQEAEDFWKLLYYAREDCLNEPNLTEDEKIDICWAGESLENNYHIFYKPLIGAALDSAEAQTQLRLYIATTKPTTILNAIVNFQFDIITNEKESMVRYNNYYVERTSLIEMLLLSLLNGRDLGIGVGTLQYDQELSRSCGSVLGINNSKSFYGRQLVMALRFMGAETDTNYCG